MSNLSFDTTNQDLESLLKSLEHAFDSEGLPDKNSSSDEELDTNKAKIQRYHDTSNENCTNSSQNNEQFLIL